MRANWTVGALLTALASSAWVGGILPRAVQTQEGGAGTGTVADVEPLATVPRNAWGAGHISDAQYVLQTWARAGGRLLLVTYDASVHCLDSATGQQHWSWKAREGERRGVVESRRWGGALAMGSHSVFLVIRGNWHVGREPDPHLRPALVSLGLEDGSVSWVVSLDRRDAASVPIWHEGRVHILDRRGVGEGVEPWLLSFDARTGRPVGEGPLAGLPDVWAEPIGVDDDGLLLLGNGGLYRVDLRSRKLVWALSLAEPL